MQRAYKRTIAFTRKYPLVRGVLSYAVIWPVGNCIQQCLTQGVRSWEELDLARLARFSLYGSCFVAPTLYSWVKISSAMWPAATFSSAITKALVEQVSYGPFATLCFFVAMPLLEFKGVEGAANEVSNKFISTYKVGVCVWPVVQTINFTFISEKNRVPFVSICSLIWTTFLSFVNQANKKAIVEQVTYTPFAMVAFFFGMSLLESKGIEGAANEVSSKFLPTYKVGVCVWPVLTTINFTFISERNRVPFVSICSLMWTTFLSFMKQADAEAARNAVTIS